MNDGARGPAWLQEVSTLVAAYPHFVLSGNIHDSYFGPVAEGGDETEPLLGDVSTLLANSFTASGFALVLSYDISTGLTIIHCGDLDEPTIEEALGGKLAELGAPNRLDGLRHLIDRVSSTLTPMTLVIESASRLVANTSSLTDDEFRFFRSIDRIARTQQPVSAESGRRYNPVIWLVETVRDLPHWFTVGNLSVRSVTLPPPDAGDRERLAARRLSVLARRTGFSESLDRPIRLLAEQTAGLPLMAIPRVLDMAVELGLGPDRIDDVARSYRLGVLENPWRDDFVVNRLRAEFGTAPLPDGRRRLRERVLGQDDAVNRVLDILARSAAGLSGAHAGSRSSRPRGVLFFAGPTGVGKTELAKVLTQLLFDDERAYVRFDMSEFSAEHSADRLIGAPPGYVGYDVGGELTNAMRARPFTIVLLDEIEKAHPRILDKFLQVLDDGRLTDGRGETVHFTESVIVFTSNLGMYHDVTEVVGGVERVRRVPSVTRESHPTRAAREATIKAEIRDYFTLKLGRPELLNRIGDDNIVIFDFIDASTADGIFRGMLANVLDRVQREHDLSVTIAPESLERARMECLANDVLAMGGRGIGSRLETVMVNPLARLLTLEHAPANPVLSLEGRENDWTCRWS